jgi:hypothetical protein
VTSGVAGTFIVTRSIFEKWSDYERMRADIHECCVILSVRTGLRFDLSEHELAAAHTGWGQEIALWLRDLLPEGTKELSHLKKAAILLAKLCEFGCITVSGEGFSDAEPEHPRSLQSSNDLLPRPTRLPEKEIRKFRDGGGAYVGWLIIYHVCEFFERRRGDKSDPYVSRITEEFEIDMVSGLLSAKISAQSIHLILKALFLRD